MAVAKAQFIKGYDADNTFRPQDPITSPETPVVAPVLLSWTDPSGDEEVMERHKLKRSYRENVS